MAEPTVRVRVERTGGIAGKPLVRDVTTGALDTSQAARLRDLAARVEPPAPPARQVPDGYRYRVDIWVGDRITHLEAADPFIPPDVRELLTMVERLGG
jgi:hypothetical protein